MCADEASGGWRLELARDCPRGLALRRRGMCVSARGFGAWPKFVVTCCVYNAGLFRRPRQAAMDLSFVHSEVVAILGGVAFVFDVVVRR